jgi:hypothetical protein
MQKPFCKLGIRNKLASSSQILYVFFLKSIKIRNRPNKEIAQIKLNNKFNLKNETKHSNTRLFKQILQYTKPYQWRFLNSVIVFYRILVCICRVRRIY